jgi:hypothetical protein
MIHWQPTINDEPSRSQAIDPYSSEFHPFK